MATDHSVLKRLGRGGRGSIDLRNELRNFSIRARKKPRRQRTMKELWSAFENQSTFHGVCHAAAAPSNRWRIMWYTAFIICSMLLVYQTMNIVRRYLEYEKTVDLDLKFEKAPFPSVTLCNLNPYKASAVEKEATIKATMDAFANAVGAKFSGDARGRRKRETPQVERRYHPVYAPCVCAVSALSGLRKSGSCLPTHKGAVLGDFGSTTPSNFRPSKCMCDFDTWSKTLWPCFPYNSWKERLCIECSATLGHCPMRFYEAPNPNKTKPRKERTSEVCLCHQDFNHCIANADGHIPEIAADGDLSNFDPASAVSVTSSTTTTTTAAPDVVEALGFEELTDEIAISTQGRENLVFAVGALPYENRTALSNTMEEFVLKCSFNQKDCDIENDFKLHYDQTYGNCFTFNWNRSKTIIASRAGANYGLRVLLYANISEYLPTSESVGFRITVHDKWHVPFPDAFGYSAPTGFLTSFGVRMKQFHRIPAPYGRCQEGGEESPSYVYYGFNYSVEGCHRSCTQKAVMDACGCADPMYPMVRGAKACSVSDPQSRECIKNTTQMFGEQIAEGNLRSCDCHQPCRETAYEMTFSTSRWPSGTAKVMECSQDDDLCLERYRRNAAMIQVFYEELNYESMSESPSYTFVSAIADFGGVTGLWIGASVVSMLEIVVLIYFMSKSYYGRKKASSALVPPVITVNNAEPLLLSRPLTPIIEPAKSPSPESEPEPEPGPVIEDRILLDLETPSPEPPSRKNTYTYMPPEKEIPCQCDLNDLGVIGKINMFCPEHGFMARRSTIYAPSNRKTSGHKPTFGDLADDDEEEEDDGTQADTAATEYDNM
uniref:Uncharacterized protein n=1 Tax=Plectus sambesii TaxID=2011161 RepID=A0A914VEX6_9BILA